jgi:hypothetical protein
MLIALKRQAPPEVLLYQLNNLRYSKRPFTVALFLNKFFSQSVSQSVSQLFIQSVKSTL